ncbi:uncharacterized protein MELLADRAFT_76472 [Melampsora larici-populina 98AG31]|uniref:Secreted protein n=1 Tax=Melampsora larici-populina (strain 98AG31 / pathotype 3-4-7) TaxID=747676 RepID=F4R6R1_MELLP|nr:uncharacterized protein MELLADRAFT_76472 [Melampsora larici-populina 98AG31]EGG11919.1 hypothetical protein MELLADRAFT_76472 [Melampsora larici-populina 98AG31]
MFFSKAVLFPIALLGCASFSRAQLQDDGIKQPNATDLVAAYPDLQNAKEEVLGHQNNLTRILSAVFNYTASQAHNELTETLSDLHNLTTALAGPPSPFLANTGPGKIPTQDECSSVFVDIINSLVQMNLAIEKLRPVAPSLHTDLQAIAAETVAALKAADAKVVITRKFIADHVDLEGIFHMHDGFEKIAMYLSEDQVNKS